MEVAKQMVWDYRIFYDCEFLIIGQGCHRFIRMEVEGLTLEFLTQEEKAR